MLIVGEKINTTLSGVEEAIVNGDKEFIQNLAKTQADGGARYIDVNCATLVGEEIKYLPWLVETVQEAVDLPCCVDSPDAAALDKGLAVHRGTALINSTTLERARYDKLHIHPIPQAEELHLLCITNSYDRTFRINQNRLSRHFCYVLPKLNAPSTILDFIGNT